MFRRRRDENREAHPSREASEVEYSFDELARGLASGTISRRKALKLVGAAVLGAGVLTAIPVSPAEAAECGTRAGCGRRCRNRRRCRCVRTVTGNVRCVRRCCTNRRCSSNGDCRNTEICMTSDCCGSASRNRGFCVPVCGERCTNTSAAQSQQWADDAGTTTTSQSGGDTTTAT